MRGKAHFVHRGNLRTLCGKPAIRYDDQGHMVGSLRCVSDPREVTCKRCAWSPQLDEYLANWHG